jgi:hypothetical protein
MLSNGSHVLSSNSVHLTPKAILNIFSIKLGYCGPGAVPAPDVPVFTPGGGTLAKWLYICIKLVPI